MDMCQSIFWEAAVPSLRGQTQSWGFLQTSSLGGWYDTWGCCSHFGIHKREYGTCKESGPRGYTVATGTLACGSLDRPATAVGFHLASEHDLPGTGCGRGEWL